MHNINELIGIIRGINFDNIINEKEVVRLQSWIDKNRNLVYDPSQVKLIKLLDEVLEDRVITDDERQLMLSYSEKFLEKTADDNTKNI